MTRPLIPGMLAEGETDEVFLSVLVARQLRQLTDTSMRSVVAVQPVQVASVRTVADKNRAYDAAIELANDCHLLFIHNDHRERRKAEWLASEVWDRVSMPVVPLVPIRETEAWMLADPDVWDAVPGANPSILPSHPRDVEKVADPKAVLQQVVPKRSGRDIRDYFEFVGNYISLKVINRVPAYAAWVSETEKALEGLGYL